MADPEQELAPGGLLRKWLGQASLVHEQSCIAVELKSALFQDFCGGAVPVARRQKTATLGGLFSAVFPLHPSPRPWAL